MTTDFSPIFPFFWVDDFTGNDLTEFHHQNGFYGFPYPTTILEEIYDEVQDEIRNFY